MVDTTVTIESSHPGVSRAMNVMAATGATVELPASLMLDGNAIEEKGVLLKAPVDIAVYVFTYSVKGYGEAYTALPVHKLGTSYISIDYNYVTIIAYQDDTHVNITVQDTVSYNGHTYYKGDQIDVYLARLNTFQIQVQCSNISSKRPVAFISSVFQIYYDTTYSTMVEYIPPTKSFGETFIVPYLGLTNASDVPVINEFTIGSTNPGSKCSSKNCVYRTNKPDLLLHYTEKYRYATPFPNVVRQYAKFVIPAISQYSNNYKYITPSAASFKNYAIIMIEARYVGGLRFDGQTLDKMIPDEQAIIVEDSTYIIATFNVTQGQHVAYHINSNITFGMIAYGFRDHDGLRYEFPVGLKLWRQSVISVQLYCNAPFLFGMMLLSLDITSL